MLDEEGREGRCIQKKTKHKIIRGDKRMGKMVGKKCQRKGRKERNFSNFGSQTGNRVNKLNTNCS